MAALFIRIRSWQWTLIGLVVGSVGALSVGMWGEPVLSAYGESINGKRQFEEALTRKEQGVPWFRDLTVHAERIGAGASKRTVHVVSGMYYDGRSSKPGGAGKPNEIVWRPAFYVAEVPYVPVTNVSALPGAGDLGARFQSLPSPTVVDFLNVMSRAKGVRFANAWWRSPANAQAVWLLVGVLGVGIAWPISLNLMVYGSVRRPREEKATDLRNVKTTAPAAGLPADNSAVMNQLDGVIDELLASTANDTVSDSAPATPPPPPIKQLVTRPLEPVVAATSGEQKAFGAAKEDYYPTEIKAAKGKPAATTNRVESSR